MKLHKVWKGLKGAWAEASKPPLAAQAPRPGVRLREDKTTEDPKDPALTSCPVCQRDVQVSAEQCPSCGVNFSKLSLKERLRPPWKDFATFTRTALTIGGMFS